MLTASILPKVFNVGEGRTATIVVMATGIRTNENNFKYQWRKRSGSSFPDKVSGINESTLTIPNVLESDNGQYYCIVTNEWDRSVESNDVTLIVFGT